MGRLIDVDNIEYYLEEGGSVVAFKADIDQIPTADIDTDSAYAEGWTAAESKYRAMMSDGDCISRQAAIDALVTPRVQDVYDSYWNGRNKQHQEDIDAIKALPSAQPEQQWISCKDRLPEVNESVLVTTEWNDISIAWRIGIDKWFIHEGNTNATTDDLAAWMPLPEPYKEKDNERA